MAEPACAAQVERDEVRLRDARAAAPDHAALDGFGTWAIRTMLEPGGSWNGASRGQPARAPRGLNPVSLMTMQRLAGNRATVVAIGRIQRQPAAMAEDVDEEEAEGQAQPGQPGQMAPAEMAASMPPDGGPPSAGAPPPGADGSLRRNQRAAANGAAMGALAGLAGSNARPGLAGLAGSNARPGLAGLAGSNTRPGLAGLAGSTGGGAVHAPRRTPPPPILAVAGGSPSGGGGSGNAIAIDAGGGGGGVGGGTTVEVGGGAGGGGNAIAIAAGTGGGGVGGGATTEVAGGGGGAGGGGNAIGVGGPADTAAPLTAPAPGTMGATTGPGGMPDPATAQTGIDWNQLLADFGSPTRTVLEIGRLIPGWGLLSGFGADTIAFAQDLASIPNSENADLATALVSFRYFVNMGNNAIGHLLYVDQLVQDGLAGSVVGAEFVPLTAAANELLSSIKVALDTVLLGTDIVIEVESLYQANHAPTSAEAEQWRQLADGYAGNILGDIVNLTLDIISLSSAGASNTAVVQEVKLPLTLAGAFMRRAAPNIISSVNNVLGVWLGSLMTGARHAYEGSPTELRSQALAWDVAGGFVDVEGARARMTYASINFVIDQLGQYADRQIEQVDAVVEALSGGKDTFTLIRDSVSQALEDMTVKLGVVQQLAGAATSAKANADAISAACSTILGTLDSLVVPTVELPEVELGEGIVAGAAEALANEAREAANAAIRRTIARVNVRIDGIKDEIRTPVEAVQERADGLAEWLALLATECESTVGTLNNYITQFSEGLARCTTAEEVIDLIVGQVSELAGTPRVTVAEVRQAWQNVGTYIDRFAALGPQMHERAADLRTHADLLEAGDATGPTFAAPPEEPPGLPGGTPGSSAHTVPETAVA